MPHPVQGQAAVRSQAIDRTDTRNALLDTKGSVTLTIGSLFAGIGGIELGLEWTGGFRTVWQVERDEYCQRVLAKHWPNATRYDDVCTVGAHNLESVDVICGGFPCQDISNAGKRAGIEGERSGLWREYARIVRALRPRYVLVENVAALLGRGLGTVLGDLSACGYDAEWSVLSAQNVGAPHLRERLFVIAYATDAIRRTNGRSVARRERTRESETGCGAVRQGNGGAGDDGPTARGTHVSHAALDRRRPRGPRRSDSSGARERLSERPLQDAADTDGNRLEELRDAGVSRGRRSSGPAADAGWWTTEPDVGRVAHGVPARVDRLRALGNAVVPQCAEFVGRLILDMEVQSREAA